MNNSNFRKVELSLAEIDRALYSPAVFASYAQGAAKSLIPPEGITMADLDFTNQSSNSFSMPVALSSAGVADISPIPKPCIFTQRNRNSADNMVLIGDSGGHQIAKNTLTLTKQLVEDIFYYQAGTCDIGHTLDIPTAPMYDQLKNNEVYSRPTFDACLFETVKYLEVFKSLGAHDHRFLNVLQGRGITDTDIWYDTVKAYEHYGWSFADMQSNPLQLTIWRILRLIEDGMFDRESTWLHFLGVGDLKTSLILTTILRCLRSRFDGQCTINISYDTKTPFIQAVNLGYMKTPNLSASQFNFSWGQVDTYNWMANVSEKFPVSDTYVGNLLTKGDLIYENWNNEGDIDEIRTLILSNHNLEMSLLAIDGAHKALDNEQFQMIPTNLINAINAIKFIFNAKDIAIAKRRLLDRAYLKPLNDAYK